MTEKQRGKLKIIMGYAAGVGKTYRMLEEAQALKADGVDLVIGYFEPHGRKDTITKTEGLEIVPRKKMDYRGSTSRRWTLKPFSPETPKCVQSTNSRTPMCLVRRGQNVGKTCRCFWTRESTC